MAKKKATIEVVTPEAVRKLVNEQFPGSLKFASDPEFRITRLPSGLLAVDDALGGGFPRGRHTEIYGDFHACKTCIALHLIAHTQRTIKGNCAYVDAERTFSGPWARHIGCKTKKLDIFSQKRSGNECFDFMELLLRSGVYDVIVLDSIASLLTEAERDASMKDGTYGTEQAKMMSKALRKLTTANTGKTALVFINQTREAIGIMFGDKTITSGGKAMGFYAGLRIQLSRSEKIKANAKQIDPKSGNEGVKEAAIGHRVSMTIRKDKTGGAKPESKSTFVFNYDLKDIDPIEDLIYVGRRHALVHKSGDHWWVEGYADERQNGRKKFKAWLTKNVAVQEDLTEMIKKDKPRGVTLTEEDDE